MRVIVLIKATSDSEAGFMPATELLEAMGNYNEELVNAGVMLAGEGPPALREGQARRLRLRQPQRHRRPFRRQR